MPAPTMLIVAGPPGGGKSSIFPLASLAEKLFNADNRAAELNGGSFESIPLSVRAVVNREFEEFVHANIREAKSFALETTLRSTITYQQAKLATRNGFRVAMVYVALDTVERHIDRVIRRAARGGHSASETTLRRIHAASLNNLPLALDPEKSGIESVRVFDNSVVESAPKLALQTEYGRVVYIAEHLPDWLRRALGWTPQDVEHRQASISRTEYHQ